MVIKKAIFKIGGSILENPKSLKNTILQLSQLVQERYIERIIIIPGGGSYANFIREIDQKLGIGNSMAHWMAIYAMDYNGISIAKQYPFIKATDKLNNIKSEYKNISIFLPFRHLKFSNPLPHSWEVTSDAIALYFTKLLKQNQAFLIKDVDGIIDNRNEVIKNLTTSDYIQLKKLDKLAKLDSNKNEIKSSKPIDDYSLKLIEIYNLSCILINGAVDGSRIYHIFAANEESKKIYTKISFS